MTATEPADGQRGQDLELYAALMTMTQQRVNHALELLNRPIRRVDLEAAALQIRVALENMTMLSLIANRPAIAAVAAAFAEKKPSEARSLAKRINSDYWPKAIRFRKEVVGENANWTMGPPDDESFLAEDEWGKYYGYCSSLLHATNPYQYLEPLDMASSDWARAQREQILEIAAKITGTLRQHQIILSETDVSLVCTMPADLSQRPTTNIYTRVRDAGD